MSRFKITAVFYIEDMHDADDAKGEAEDILSDAGLHDAFTGLCTAQITAEEVP